ncbi:MAG: GTP-binding protein [Candidatus Lokiarchaeota archaeon]|nr:GTP-binding protein [Candidatus Lokiarchaeota archaeon]
MSDYIVKIPLVGNGGVGKTSFAYRFVNSQFTQQYKMTIGVDFQIKNINLPDGTEVKVQLWDTGGQTRFTSIRSMYYKGSSGFLIMFDVTNRKSFQDLGKWVEEVRKHSFNENILIIGNKIDLIDQRLISYRSGNEFASDIGALYAETSAKTGEGINEAMLNFVQLIINDLKNIPKVSVKGDISKLKRTVDPQLLYEDEIVLYELKK